MNEFSASPHDNGKKFIGVAFDPNQSAENSATDCPRPNCSPPAGFAGDSASSIPMIPPLNRPVVYCLGRHTIEKVANNGEFIFQSSSNGDKIHFIAASDLDRQNPYKKIAELETKLNRTTRAADLMSREIERHRNRERGYTPNFRTQVKLQEANDEITRLNGVISRLQKAVNKFAARAAELEEKAEVAPSPHPHNPLADPITNPIFYKVVRLFTSKTLWRKLQNRLGRDDSKNQYENIDLHVGSPLYAEFLQWRDAERADEQAEQRFDTVCEILKLYTDFYGDAPEGLYRELAELAPAARRSRNNRS